MYHTICINFVILDLQNATFSTKNVPAAAVHILKLERYRED